MIKTKSFTSTIEELDHKISVYTESMTGYKFIDMKVHPNTNNKLIVVLIFELIEK